MAVRRTEVATVGGLTHNVNLSQMYKLKPEATIMSALRFI